MRLLVFLSLLQPGLYAYYAASLVHILGQTVIARQPDSEAGKGRGLGEDEAASGDAGDAVDASTVSDAQANAAYLCPVVLISERHCCLPIGVKSLLSIKARKAAEKVCRYRDAGGIGISGSCRYSDFNFSGTSTLIRCLNNTNSSSQVTPCSSARAWRYSSVLKKI